MNRRSAIKVAIVVLSVVTLFEVWSRQRGNDPADPDSPVAITEEEPVSRSVDEPMLDLRALDTLDPTPGSERPPARHQWVGEGAVPTNQWWSPALLGPGSLPLWARPLVVSIDEDGAIGVGNGPANRLDADTWISPPGAVLRLLGDAALETQIVDAGAFHVTVELIDVDDVPQVRMDVVKGQPFVELDAAGRLSVAGGPARAIDDGVFVIDAGGQTWFVAGDEVELDGAAAFITGRALVGLVPDSDDADQQSYLDAVRGVLGARLLDTVEETAWNGSTGTQELRVRRTTDIAQPFLLLDHHRPLDDDPVVGEVFDRDRTRPVVIADAVRTTVVAPVLWGAVEASPVTDDWFGDDQLPSIRRAGSYFGGKDVLHAAMIGDLAAAHGRDAAAARAFDLAREFWQPLADGTEPRATLESTWGTVILSPAEFGSGTDLNDHHLQYGYWVAAAAYLAERDSAWAADHASLVDTLIADYAGTAVLGVRDARLASHRTWDPYEGHGWASGTAPFADGNNLESTSESALSWWAAARWFIVTDRPELAESFLVRHALEHESARVEMLPTGETAGRPWGGIAWGGKQDPNTFFSPSPASALGIKLLPLGPMSVSRYRDSADVDAATRRADWCVANDECLDLWPNLLASDHLLGGRPTERGEPSEIDEQSTPDALLSWWSALWADAIPAEDLRCTPGAIAIRGVDGRVVVHATNPTTVEATVSCTNAEGTEVWRRIVEPGARFSIEVQ